MICWRPDALGLGFRVGFFYQSRGICCCGLGMVSSAAWVICLLVGLMEMSRWSAKGLRSRNSPTCTLSQNGYGDDTLDSWPRLEVAEAAARLAPSWIVMSGDPTPSLSLSPNLELSAPPRQTSPLKCTCDLQTVRIRYSLAG